MLLWSVNGGEDYMCSMVCWMYWSLDVMRPATALKQALRRRLNGQHFVDNIFKLIFCIFVNDYILIQISLKFVPTRSIDNVNVGWNNGLSPKSWHAIISISDAWLTDVYWHHSALMSSWTVYNSGWLVASVIAALWAKSGLYLQLTHIALDRWNPFTHTMMTSSKEIFSA